ncbi:GNAT family N-acetyltransferase [Halopiger goleimassiliensis]|uniref:GNAT family N-acetyltransferase n=1 Tax=Halopiger goleimassiliensis TaxID=1293048 RepID=UPI00067774DB|nr:GNAT family N-acetyltransferase [Halopiger goleimassiliensis]
MLFPEHLETERLRLERLSPETVDVFAYYEHCSHHEPAIDEITAYLPWHPHETVKETTEYLEELAAKWEAGTRAEYVLRPKDGEDGADEIAGSGGLLVDWERRTGKPAIWLRKRFWGRGYSGERAAAVLELAFDRLELDLVAVPVQDGNENSRAAVERYVEAHGGQYDGIVRNATVRPDGAIVDHHRYTITREQYRGAVDD